MENDRIRLVVFVLAVSFFLLWELLAPHHAPRVVRTRRWIANWSMTVINTVMSIGLCAVCLFLTTRELWPWSFGMFDSLQSHPHLRIVGEILFLDAMIYWQHRVFHAVPLLWRFHRVHHTDLDLDVSTASRFHFGEIFISAMFKMCVALLMGISITGLAVFEAIIVAASHFQHSNIAVPKFLERVLWFIVVPPAMHRIHHCPRRRHCDSNYGTLLTLWDWLFGTLRHPVSHDANFGLPDVRTNLPLHALLALPMNDRLRVHDERLSQ
jgi:sterol desaturase/sphingolipid hydroxylase (fatty acid hydroxylase superfamily)